MNNNQYIVALEIGSSKIVGAVAEKSSAGYLTVSHLVEQRHSNIVRYGIVQNVENIKTSVTHLLKQLENQLDGRITQAYVGVSGKSLHSVMSEVNRSVESTAPITQELIDRIISDATRNPLRSYETIDVVPCTYYVDKVEASNPVGQFGSSIKIKVNQIVAKPTLKLNLERVMASCVPNVKGYIVTPLAVGEQILTDSDRQLGCMLVDMGAETTSVSIYKNGALMYLVTLPLGGRNLTLDVKNGLNVLEDTAEQVKKNINNPLDPANVSNVEIENVKAQDAANYISARMDEIIANIKQQIENAGLQSGAIQSIVLIGGSAHLGGLQQKMYEKTGIPVRLGQNPSRINILNGSINRMEYIEIFSLLTKASDLIEPGETCMEITDYNDGPGMNRPEYEPADPKPATNQGGQPKKEDKPRKPSRWGGMLDKLRNQAKNLMSEDDAEDEYNRR